MYTNVRFNINIRDEHRETRLILVFTFGLFGLGCLVSFPKQQKSCSTMIGIPILTNIKITLTFQLLRIIFVWNMTIKNVYICKFDFQFLFNYFKIYSGLFQVFGKKDLPSYLLSSVRSYVCRSAPTKNLVCLTSPLPFYRFLSNSYTCRPKCLVVQELKLFPISLVSVRLWPCDVFCHSKIKLIIEKLVSVTPPSKLSIKLSHMVEQSVHL